jgi:hypothetical protein
MADYQSLLSRAVANLPSGSSRATRQAIYDRARKALLTQLRTLRPPLPEGDIVREESALDAAIAQVEARFAAPEAAAQSAAPASGRPTAPGPSGPQPFVSRAPSGAQVLSAPPRPAAAAGAERIQSGAIESSAAVGRSAAVAPPRGPAAPPARGRAQPAPTQGAQAAAVASAATLKAPPAPGPSGARGPKLSVSPTAPQSAEAVKLALPTSAKGENSPAAAPAASLENVIPAAKAEAAAASAAPPVVASREKGALIVEAPEIASDGDRVAPAARTDAEGQRPVAPGAPAIKSRSLLWSALAVLAGVVVSVAVAAIVMRQKPQDLAISPPPEPQQAAAPESPPKSAERVQSGPANPASPAAAPSEAQGQPAGAQSSPPSSQGAEGQVAVAPPPVAARAAMLVASPDDPQKPVVNLGSTVWSTIPPAPGQPATIAVKADADIPDLKMHATMTLRKNTDPTLQATHTMDLKFLFADGAPITGFKDVGLPQMRKLDSTASETLTSVKVKISDVYFLIALASGPQDVARNLDLMQTRAWFDFPLLLNDSRIAKIVFQKSPEGEAMLAKAFETWR